MQINQIKNQQNPNFKAIKISISKNPRREVFKELKRELNNPKDLDFGKAIDGDLCAYIIKYAQNTLEENALVKKLSLIDDKIKAIPDKEAKADVERLKKEHLNHKMNFLKIFFIGMKK